MLSLSPIFLHPSNLFRCMDLFYDLLQDNGSVSQMIHDDSVTRHQAQTISNGQRKLNPAVIINIGNQFITNYIP